jgi:hypothetical protein
MACGLHTITNAARHLGSLPPNGSARRVLDALSQRDRKRVEAQLRTQGLIEKDIRALANAAGLGVYRWNGVSLGQLKKAEGPWVAFVRVRFFARASSEEVEDDHYVLVLEYIRDSDEFVLADPHPWNPGLYFVRARDFDAAWRSTDKKGPPLALWLSRAT